MQNNCSGYSTTVNMKGQVTIKFNQQMNTSLNTSWINWSNTQIKVLPQDKRDQEVGFKFSNKGIIYFGFLIIYKCS